MRLSRIYRKKRKVPLLLVPLAEREPQIMSQWVPPTQNAPGREEDWFRSIFTSHRAFCGCGDPVLHLSTLAATYGFQPGPPPSGGPRERLTPPLIRGLPALPAAPTTPRPPPCGGNGGRGAGGDRQDGGGDGDGDEQPLGDVDELLDLLDDAE